jgi:hypothetical protein
MKKVDPKKVVVLDGDDWSGLYVGGKLVYEGHKVPLHELSKALGFEVVNVEPEDGEEWAEYGYRCPDELSDFKKK